MLKLPSLSLYIHIPWCIQKCPYCDFNSHTFKGEAPHAAYIDHLLADLDSDLPMADNREISTIFLGGGTPSLLSASVVQLLLNGIRSRTCVSDNAEITMEANPGSSTKIDRFIGYQNAGINRISLGVQTFNDKQLIRLGRIHSAKEAKSSAHLISNLDLRSLNFDLMHGLPNQLLSEALSDLRQAIAFNPPHLSWYQLTIEPHTLFNARPPVLPDEDVLLSIAERGDQLLKANGYHQYEISSYSKSGYQCQHNLNYWRFGDYLGIGCGAHGKVTFSDGRILRTEKTRHPRGFMQGKYKYKQYEIALKDRPFEFFMNRFRLLDPIPRSDFINYTGISESVIREQLDAALFKGYLSERQKNWQITQKGILFLNNLLELFLV